MPDLTINLGLKKPTDNETADIAVINENMDTIDLELTKKATQTQDGRMSKEDKVKLDGIETGANNYVHPSTHPATMIEEDSTHRFVTDTEKSIWNAKETPTGAQAKANTAEANAKTYAEGLFDDLAGEGRTTETIKANADNIALHENNKNNPHNVTVTQIGAETPLGAQAKVDSHANATSVHGATSSASANRIILRDAYGRAKVAAPSANDDIARKAEVDVVQTDLNNHKGATGSAHGVATTSVNGFMSAADKQKLNGIESGAQVNPTASEIRDALKTVDGTGSEIDADLLDGWHRDAIRDWNNILNKPSSFNLLNSGELSAWSHTGMNEDDTYTLTIDMGVTGVNMVVLAIDGYGSEEESQGIFYVFPDITKSFRDGAVSTIFYDADAEVGKSYGHHVFICQSGSYRYDITAYWFWISSGRYLNIKMKCWRGTSYTARIDKIKWCAFA